MVASTIGVRNANAGLKPTVPLITKSDSKRMIRILIRTLMLMLQSLWSEGSMEAGGLVVLGGLLGAGAEGASSSVKESVFICPKRTNLRALANSGSSSHSSGASFGELVSDSELSSGSL